MEEKKQFAFDDPESATLQTVTGWVSRDGSFYGDNEGAARFAGCTLKKCAGCGALVEKYRCLCRACQYKKTREVYLNLPKKKWDGVAMLAEFDEDQYFVSPEDAMEYADDNGISVEDLQLVICEPVFYHEIDPRDVYQDELPEEGEVDRAIEKAFEKLNAAIRAHKEPISWMPGKFALDLEGVKTNAGK